MAYTSQDVRELAAMISGEASNQKYDAKLMVGSTAINRLLAKRAKEFGTDVRSVLHNPNAYYSVRDRNEPYKQAITGKFNSKQEENSYKESYAIASGLLKGTIKPVKGQFFFTDDEVVRMKKQGKKVFDFKKVKELGKVGIWNVYTY